MISNSPVLGLADDFVPPALRLFSRLPVVGKVGVGLAAGVAGASALANSMAYRPDTDQGQ